MTFPTEATKTPLSVRDISIDLFDGQGEQEARYNVQIVFSDGSIVVRTGDLIPHLTSGQITQLQSFMSAMRTKAETEFLP